MENINQNIGILSLLSLKGIGQAFIKKNVANTLFKGDIKNGITQALLKGNKSFNEQDIMFSIDQAKATIQKSQEQGITIINQFEDNYPESLLALRDCPSLLFLRGNLKLLNNVTIAIIGTRKPNSNGQRIAEKISAHYHERKWNLCNGLAEGIDKAAIITNGKYYDQVIGVVAGGLNFMDKKTLLKTTAFNAEKILESGGLLISEESLDKKEDTFTIVKSCRLQAGISNGLILIQSSIDGGSKYTLKSFAELERPLAIINPVSDDYHDPAYLANKLIIEEKVKGIEKFTELKSEKVKTREIMVFFSKADYPNFDSLVLKSNLMNSNKSTLF